MCGRFGSTYSGTELTNRYDLIGKIPSFQKSYNTAPSFTIPTVIQKSPNHCELMRWGFMPEWADPKTIKLTPINARDDSLEKSGFYRGAFHHSRCIIPFSFFFEWKRFNKGGEELKQPYLIKLKDQKIGSFAGIYSERKDAEGKPHFTCAIVTTKPNSLMEKIHNRMPVIVEGENENTWLNERSDIEDVKKLLKPYDSEKMESYRVSTMVNSPRNNSPEIIKSID